MEGKKRGGKKGRQQTKPPSVQNMEKCPSLDQVNQNICAEVEISEVLATKLDEG